jgi:tetratricopeptide (TPR) repeat protein
MKKFCLIFFVFLLVAGCASKRFTKQAAKFEQAGLYEDAAEYYYEAAKRKDSNVDAKLGLRKNGQITLEKKLSDFMKAYNGADFQEAVYKFKDAESYYKKLKTVGVDLNFPESYNAYYDEAKGDFLNKKYVDGIDKLNREDFTGARKVFDEILGIDPNYKDVKEKNIVARYEPMYREANQYLDNSLYRKAFNKFNEIIAGTGGYKQSAALKDEALEKGTLTILITDFTYSSGVSRETATSISAKVKGQLGKLPNPFIKIIDQAAVNQSVFEKGKINLQAANLAGIKSVLSGNASEVALIEGKVKKTIKRGYLKEVSIVKNEAGQEIEKIKWHKVEYSEFEVENKARLNLSFKLVSTENGEVLVNDIFNISNSDKANYARFDGEKTNLVPGYWKSKDGSSPEDVIKNNPGDINNLKKLLNAKQTIKTTTSLLSELMDHVAEGITDKVDKYNPENK